VTDDETYGSDTERIAIAIGRKESFFLKFSQFGHTTLHVPIMAHVVRVVGHSSLLIITRSHRLDLHVLTLTLHV